MAEVVQRRNMEVSIYETMMIALIREMRSLSIKVGNKFVERVIFLPQINSLLEERK